MKKQEAAIE